jgi:hypothetical protein
LTCSTDLFHASLPIVIVLDNWIFIFPRSFVTSPAYLNLCLPVVLTMNGLHSATLVIVPSLPNFTICLIHFILCVFIYVTVSECLISQSIFLLVPILQLFYVIFNTEHFRNVHVDLLQDYGGSIRVNFFHWKCYSCRNILHSFLVSVSAPDMLVTTCCFLSSLFTVKLSLHFSEKNYMW